MLAYLSAGGNAVASPEKHLCFLRAVTKLLLSQFGSRHYKIQLGASGSSSCSSSCTALQGTPEADLHAYLPADLNGNEGKQGQKW